MLPTLLKYNIGLELINTDNISYPKNKDKSRNLTEVVSDLTSSSVARVKTLPTEGEVGKMYYDTTTEEYYIYKSDGCYHILEDSGIQLGVNFDGAYLPSNVFNCSENIPLTSIPMSNPSLDSIIKDLLVGDSVDLVRRPYPKPIPGYENNNVIDYSEHLAGDMSMEFNVAGKLNSAIGTDYSIYIFSRTDTDTETMTVTSIFNYIDQVFKLKHPLGIDIKCKLGLNLGRIVPTNFWYETKIITDDSLGVMMYNYYIERIKELAAITEEEAAHWANSPNGPLNVNDMYWSELLIGVQKSPSQVMSSVMTPLISAYKDNGLDGLYNTLANYQLSTSKRVYISPVTINTFYHSSSNSITYALDPWFYLAFWGLAQYLPVLGVMTVSQGANITFEYIDVDDGVTIDSGNYEYTVVNNHIKFCTYQ